MTDFGAILQPVNQTPPRAEWTNDETRALIQIRHEMDNLFTQRSRRRPLWNEVARRMATLGYNKTTDQCWVKFKKLNQRKTPLPPELQPVNTLNPHTTNINEVDVTQHSKVDSEAGRLNGESELNPTDQSKEEHAAETIESKSIDSIKLPPLSKKIPNTSYPAYKMIAPYRNISATNRLSSSDYFLSEPHIPLRQFEYDNSSTNAEKNHLKKLSRKIRGLHKENRKLRKTLKRQTRLLRELVEYTKDSQKMLRDAFSSQDNQKLEKSLKL
ncbi:uncharacterized protein VTP21DRAFT_10053 [Calcarisporiella thermophila]|uniref:uncharacterized protein n=1 Tax=Calcarisporiella thermophila TaxID=911321 RepID=UPI00374285D5